MVPIDIAVHRCHRARRDHQLRTRWMIEGVPDAVSSRGRRARSTLVAYPARLDLEHRSSARRRHRRPIEINGNGRIDGVEGVVRDD
ncbi:MAG: hypothetical protein S0880_14600, partial [Actinomycetota bacterium]|nr:hypothetical protein [Actinomycetota bacterium]